MQIDRHDGQLGAFVSDVNAARLTLEQARELKHALYQHKLLVLRDQDLDAAEYLAFARMLGTPQVYLQSHYHHPKFPEIFVSSNVLEDGRKVGVSGTGQYWHTDYQFMPEPLSTTLVYPQILPNGRRETFYIDMVRVLSRLPRSLQAALSDKRFLHEAKWRYKITPGDVDRALVDVLHSVARMAPAASHPAIITHPVTRERALYVSRGFSTGVVGLEPAESSALLNELIAFVEQPEHIHTHTWREGDILFWDNRSLLHCASQTPAGEQSKSYRIGVYDGLPFYVEAATLPESIHHSEGDASCPMVFPPLQLIPST